MPVSLDKAIDDKRYLGSKLLIHAMNIDVIRNTIA